MMVDALDKVSNFYDKEVPRQVDRTMALVQPAITLFMGVGVCTAILAALLPMMKLIGEMGK